MKTFIVMYLNISQISKRLVSQTPYLIEQTSIAPHITGSGVLLEVDCFWGSPLHRDLTTMRDIASSQVTCHPKITNLKEYQYHNSDSTQHPCRPYYLT